MIQDVNAGSIDVYGRSSIMAAPLIQGGYATASMPTLSSDVYGQPSTMASPLIEGGYVNASMLTFSTDVYGQPSAMPSPFVQGGFTSLLLGVEQDATLSSAARKLPFDD